MRPLKLVFQVSLLVLGALLSLPSFSQSACDDPQSAARDTIAELRDVLGNVLVTRRLFRFGSAIPDIIKKMVPEKMLEMVDTNYFDTVTYLSRFTMHSEYSPDKVKITATCPYTELSPNLTVREYDVHVHVDIPMIGRTVAKAIADSHREALIKDHEIILKACERVSKGS